MPSCPSYRVRLFLSVDLVGSTAYKASSASIEKNTQQPLWVSKLKAFYQEFPNALDSNFERVKLGQKKQLPRECGKPQVWKTVGDEILFCCRVYSAQHAAVCVRSFLDALEFYGNYLEKDTGGALDVKGAGWLAAFPTPNVTVRLPGKEMDLQEGDETFEEAADKDVSGFDFLGQNIDAGFRTCKNAEGDFFSTSVELAYLLSSSDQAKDFVFYYEGRQSFKGVIANRPYPIVLIYTERKQNRRDIKEKEDNILGKSVSKPAQLHEFLGAFMDDEGIEKPCLDQHETTRPDPAPQSYIDFEAIWSADNKERGQRDKLLEEAENVADGGNSKLPAEIEKYAQTIIRRSPRMTAPPYIGALRAWSKRAAASSASKATTQASSATKKQPRSIVRSSKPSASARPKPSRPRKPEDGER